MTRRRCLHALCAVLVAGALGACASKPVTPGQSWSGRFSLQVLGSTAQTFSANFELSGDVRRGQLMLSTVLGASLARLQWDQERAVLERADSTQTANDLQSLVAEVLQTPLPVHALLDWMRGQPTPAMGWRLDTQALDEGRLEAQRDWPSPQARLRLRLER